jgi:hypothetical protein
MFFHIKTLRLPLVLALLVLAAGAALAANAGSIVGRVIDRGTGEELVGANVIVQETELGAATDVNGRYQIINIPPGKYRVTTSYYGYNDVTVTDVQVIQDQAVTLDFKLSKTVVDVGVKVEVYAIRSNSSTGPTSAWSGSSPTSSSSACR